MGCVSSFLHPIRSVVTYFPPLLEKESSNFSPTVRTYSFNAKPSPFQIYRWPGSACLFIQMRYCMNYSMYYLLVPFGKKKVAAISWKRRSEPSHLTPSLCRTKSTYIVRV